MGKYKKFGEKDFHWLEKAREKISPSPGWSLRRYSSKSQWPSYKISQLLQLCSVKPAQETFKGEQSICCPVRSIKPLASIDRAFCFSNTLSTGPSHSSGAVTTARSYLFSACYSRPHFWGLQASTQILYSLSKTQIDRFQLLKLNAALSKTRTARKHQPQRRTWAQYNGRPAEGEVQKEEQELTTPSFWCKQRARTKPRCSCQGFQHSLTFRGTFMQFCLKDIWVRAAGSRTYRLYSTLHLQHLPAFSLVPCSPFTKGKALTKRSMLPAKGSNPPTRILRSRIFNMAEIWSMWSVIHESFLQYYLTNAVSWSPRTEILHRKCFKENSPLAAWLAPSLLNKLSDFTVFYVKMPAILEEFPKILQVVFILFRQFLMTVSHSILHHRHKGNK